MPGQVAAELLEKKALFSRAAHDGRTARSTPQKQRKRAQIETRDARFAAVAVPTVGFEDRQNIAFEGRAWRFLAIRAGSGCPRRCKEAGNQSEPGDNASGG
jgi:hypothetical protein